VQLQELVRVSARVAATSSRLEKIAILRALLLDLAPEEIAVGVRFLSGELRQAKLGIGPAALFRARPPQRAGNSALSLLEADVALERIAAVSGKGAASERQRLLVDLFARVSELEQDFLIRLMLGELRQGALTGIMHDALAQAARLPVSRVRRAAMLAGGLADVAHAALTEGAQGLDRFGVQIFQPVLPMLAQPAEDITHALSELGMAAFEWKLDGARIQVHKRAGEVRVYSRALNDVSGAVPEIIERVRALPCESAILDGEAIALRADGRPYPFQTTMSRFSRKLEVAAARLELPLTALYFDALHIDNCDLIDAPTSERFDAAARIVPADMLVPRLITADAAAAQAFLDGALARGHEGVMAKALQVPYEAGSRGSSWLKIKQAHTLDLVVLAAEWGHGRRHGWLSNLHLGARDPVSGQFVMLGKTFKGLTDEMLAWQTTKLLELEVERDAYTVYVRPELVVEIAVNEIQESPQYPARMALRFARVKGYRSDKHAAEADTIDTVRELFARHGARA
jgi:DNA ligase-1